MSPFRVLPIAFSIASGLILVVVGLSPGTAIWTDLDRDSLSKTRVGQVYSQCCTMSTFTSCEQQRAFQCRSNPACSQGQTFQGSCTPGASCGGSQANSSCDPPVQLQRTVDECEVTGTILTAGCQAGQGYCEYDYTGYDAPGRPQ
jgi:hypothetical protein